MLCKVIFFDSHNKQEGRFISVFNWRSWNVEGWVVAVAVQVAKSCPTLRSLTDCSTPGSSVLHQVPELAQLHVHWVSDAIQPSHPLLSPSPAFLQSFPASGSFLMSRLFTSGGQSIGASVLASVLPMNIQGWFPLGLTCLISLLSKGLSRVFSRTTVRKHQRISTLVKTWETSFIQR